MNDVSRTPAEIIAQRGFSTIISVTAGAGAGVVPPPPAKKDEDDHRYYHCYLEWNGLNCHPVEKFNAESAKDNSLLMSVPKFYPFALDKHYISWNFRPKCNIIESDQK
jgi:hypothetical protein